MVSNGLRLIKGEADTSMFFLVFLWLALLGPSEQAEMLQIQQAIQAGKFLDQADSLLVGLACQSPARRGLDQSARHCARSAAANERGPTRL